MRYTILVLLTYSWFFSCKEKIETITPTRESITESVYASGIIKSQGQYNAYSTVSGIINKWLVSEGDVVQEGTPLVILNNTASKLSVQNAELSAVYNNYASNTSKLKELKLTVDLAKQKYENDSLLFVRQIELKKQGVGAEVEYEQRELAVKNTKTAYNSALLKYIDLKKQLEFLSQQSQKNLQLSRNQANDFVIRSELNGKVYSKLKEKGELATPQTPLAIVGDADTFLLELQVDEYDVVKTKKGQQVWITLDSYKGKKFEGRVRKIHPYMNERTKSFTVEAYFIRQPDLLYPNLTAEANIVIQSKSSVLTLPRSYVSEDGFVIKKNGDKVKVQTGLKDYQKIEIISGISALDELQKP